MIYGTIEEWNFVQDSFYGCSVEKCPAEVVLVERLSGKRLCLAHAPKDAISKAKEQLFKRQKTSFG